MLLPCAIRLELEIDILSTEYSISLNVRNSLATFLVACSKGSRSQSINNIHYSHRNNGWIWLDRSGFPDDVDAVLLRNSPQVRIQIARQEYDSPSDAIRPTPDREDQRLSSYGPLQLSSVGARGNDWLRARNCVDSFPLSLPASCHGIEAILNPYHYYFFEIDSRPAATGQLLVYSQWGSAQVCT
jgi:hypothetical protein